MSERNTITLDELKSRVDGDPIYSKWFELTQDRIDKFADVTEDWQFIHIDPEKAKHTPFGGTIAHGYLTVSMLSAMSYDCVEALEGAAMVVNYGFNKLRFTNPVKAGGKVRAKFVVKNVDEKSATNILTTYDVTVEIEGEKRPALMAEWLGLTILKG